MSDSPVIFKRSKPKPGQRARQKSPDANDTSSEFTSQGAEVSPITLASKLKNKAKRSKPKSRLSFGGDDDTEGDGQVFQVKKSNLSQKLKLGSHPGSPANLPASLDQANISNGAPSYNAAYLSELKASTPSSRRPPINDPYDADMSMDIGDISMQSIESVDVLAADNESVIPSESSILNAKQKRERIRTTTASNEEDYISLSVIKRSDESQGPHPDSRLVREEDELGEGDDEFAEFTSAQERIPLGKKSKKVAASKRKETMQEMIEDAAEEDEETMEWEQEQLRRGGHLGDESVDKAPVKQVYKATPIPTSTPIPTLGPAIARLTQSLTALTTSHASNTSAMASLAEEREQLDKREMEMREMVRGAEAKRSWFVSFREWVESVATFLDEKFPQLEKLEDEHISILKERSDMISQRRRADDADDLSLFLGTLPTPPQPDTEVVDDLGRTVPRTNPAAARRDRITTRSARRSHRRAASAQTQTEEEGYSTDSSLPPSDKTDFTTAVNKLSTSTRAILSDVRAEEYKNPSLGLGKWFGEWRNRYADVYTGAWGGLGLVGAWEFWVRLELVGWNPIEDARRTSLDGFNWYSALHEYSRPSVENDEESELGPDGDLVSAMISTAVVPRLCKVVEGGAFDPYSNKNLRRMVDLAEQVEASVEKDSQKFQMLLKSVYTVFANDVSTTESLLAPYLSLHSPPFNPESIPARQRFLARRTKLVQNIIRWRKYTGERFGIGELATRLVVRCIVPVAESGWDVGGETSVRKVITILPSELVPPSLKSRLRN